MSRLTKASGPGGTSRIIWRMVSKQKALAAAKRSREKMLQNTEKGLLLKGPQVAQEVDMFHSTFRGLSGYNTIQQRVAGVRDEGCRGPRRVDKRGCERSKTAASQARSMAHHPVEPGVQEK